MAKTKKVVIDGFTFNVNPDTGKPLGRPPAHPKKHAAWVKLKIEAEKASFHGTLDQLVEEHQAIAPKPEVEEPEDVVLAKIQERFDIMRTIAEGACEGLNKSVIVSGAGGVGKTHTITEIVEQYAEDGEITVDFKSGVVSPVNLYMILYANRAKNQVLILDDADNVFWNEDSLSILKAALDTKPKRKVTWASQSSALADDDIPKEFFYEGSIIFITNLDFQNIVDSGRGKLAPHLEALMTRTLYLDLRLHRVRDVALWVDFMVNENDILVNQCGLTVAQQEQVLKFIRENMHSLRNLSIRTAVKIAQFMKMAPKEWKAMATTLEMKGG